MKQPAVLNNDEAQEVLWMIESRLHSVNQLFDSHDLELMPKIRGKRNRLIGMRDKLWAQLHGTEATDVEGV